MYLAMLVVTVNWIAVTHRIRSSLLNHQIVQYASDALTSDRQQRQLFLHFVRKITRPDTSDVELGK
jgi:hypothetical protein